MSVYIHVFVLYLGHRALKKGKKVENVQLNALVSWEMSFTVFHLRLECVLFMSGLTPHADSHVGFWVAIMKVSKSSVSFPSSQPCFQKYQNKRKNLQQIGSILLQVMFMLVFVGGRTTGSVQKISRNFFWRIHLTVSYLLSYTE